MFTTKHWVKLLVFGLIAVLSVGYAGGRYAGLDRLFGTRGYRVVAQLTDSGGIFTGAEVTYRGVAVGQVSALHVTPQGVSLDLDIDSGPAIPSDTEAVVADRSAVGEQYVDLRPNRDDGPYLGDGSVITTDRTALPIAPETVLASLDRFVSSVDPRSLRTVVGESYDAFHGTGPDLARLLDTAGAFTGEARRNLPQTTRLLADGRTVLATQQRQADDITAIASGLRAIAGQLRSSDPDLRTVIDQAPALSDEVESILVKSGSDLSVLTANLLTTAQITAVRTGAIEQQLVALPVISAFGPSVSANGEGRLGLVLNFFDPHSCTKGYESTPQRPANDVSEAPPNTLAYCAEPPGSGTDVRGAQNAPFAGKPAAVSQLSAAPAGAPDGRSQLPGVLGLAGTGVAAGIGRLLGLPG
ncbi:MCE family protein [Amycolatopsis sp. K13G38]|uniref:MCE family protein n=1 Tax=Amycolatopsis acididurans TaxID=2724524 RepID=A0ABX1JBF7_9PSEU|nr:MlaD family protein [Amycolatopsis acididurans]NKQ56229.1 MCE family protein [Amycolatopsis acididurans]